MKHLQEMKVDLVALSLLGLLIVAGSTVAFAQVTASISGRIEDPSGAAIPEAMVTVTNLETGAARTVMSDAGGAFLVLSLPVGRYEVKVEKTGFKAAAQTGINLVVGQQAVVNLRLEVGAVSEQVTVTGEAALVNTTTSSVTGLVGEREVKDLPLNGRSFDQLITLNAGTVNYSSLKIVGTGSPAGNRFTVAGRRYGENYFLLNGVELSGPNQDYNTPWGASGLLLGVEAIREFNVQTDTYGAEYGKKSGAQVTIVTQSGGNQFHGSLFEFLRNNHMDARNFFDRFKIPPFKRNQFGVSAGGPIRKDKTFIFGNYEGFRHRLGLSSVTFVPDANARRGLLPDPVTGVPTPVVGLQPAILPYMAYWPEPNGPSIGGGIGQAFGSPAEAIREDYGTIRVDHTFSDKDSLAVNYTISDGLKISPLPTPTFADNINMRYQVLSLQQTHVFSPSLINTFTAGVSRVWFDYDTLPFGVSSLPLLIAGTLHGEITIGTGSGGGGASGSITPTGGTQAGFFKNGKTLFTYSDQLQVVRGSHQITAGAWFQRQRDNEAGASNVYGRADFGSLQGFLQASPTNFQIDPNQPTHQWRQTQGAWFVQDSMQLRPNLTVRLGLRHEFSNGWNDPTGRGAYWAFDSNEAVLTKPVVGKTAIAENNAKWLFGPRIGVAWDPFGNGKTSVRTGFGTYYYVIDAYSPTRNIPLGSPFTGQVSFLSLGSPGQPTFLSLLPVNPLIPVPPICGPGVPQPCTTNTAPGIQNNIKMPTIEEWNLSVEQQIASNTSLRVAYVGSKGFHIVAPTDWNTIRPQICSNAAGCESGGLNANPAGGVAKAKVFVPQGTLYIPGNTALTGNVDQLNHRPNPYIGVGGTSYRSQADSTYHALQLEVKHRYSHGLEFKGNYTWSRNLDDAGAPLGANRNSPNVLDPYNLSLDKGPAASDYTHQASISGGYELPIGQGKAWLSGASGVANKLASGWQLNWIFTATTGYPLNPLAGSNRSGNGDLANTDRVLWNPAFTGNVNVHDPNKWYDPNAFALPTIGTWGNVGKGQIRGPSVADLDMSFFKNTQLTERIKLQFRAEAFNILNHTNLGFPNTSVFVGTALTPSAGRISDTQTTSRQIQFGLKLNF